MNALEKRVRECIDQRNKEGTSWSLLSSGAGEFIIRVDKPKKHVNPEYRLYPNITAYDIERMIESCGADEDLVSFWIKLVDNSLHFCIKFFDGSPGKVGAAGKEDAHAITVAWD